jgi:tripartite motif-containing protein 2/3/tripartite motif-containing protein 71
MCCRFSYNHCIQVFKPNLEFDFAFGCKGSKEGQFYFPHFITFDNEGMVYVSSDHSIQKFTPDGSAFGTSGSDPGQLKNPEGIAIVNNLLYVAERENNRISIFTIDGKFIRCFGSRGSNEDQFNKPRGIAFDNNGCLYICDSGNNRLVALS